MVDGDRDPQGDRGTDVAADEAQDRWTTEGLEVIRHEEELTATVTPVPYERVRISKRIVTETVTIDVTLRREELVVEHLPLEAPAVTDGHGALRSGVGRLKDSVLSRFARRTAPAAISEEAVELGLLEEHYEVVKRVVPRERVRLTREVQTAQAPVSGTIRKELVNVDQVPIDDLED